MIDEKKVQRIKSRFAAWFASSALSGFECIDYYEKYSELTEDYTFCVSVPTSQIFFGVLLQYLVHLARISRVTYYMTTEKNASNVECLVFIMH